MQKYPGKNDAAFYMCYNTSFTDSSI